MPSLELLVNGVLYGGWTRARVSRGVDRIAGTFELSVTELWPNSGPAREIPPGSRCELKLDGETVITGWVDENGVAYSSTSHEVTVRGRDATGDLVDCSAIHETGEWSGQNMLQIARDLCAPFGISVSADADVGEAFSPTWQVNPGETVFCNLERMARHRGVLIVSDGKGALVIKKPSSQKISTALVLGRNILSANGKNSHLERFSKYIVKSQFVVSDEWGVEPAALSSATETDPAVARYRPLIVNAEDMADESAMRKRATWERNVRAGRSLEISVTVQGWKNTGGLWLHDRIVAYRDAFMRVDRELYVVSVEHTLDEGGTRTTLCLTLPEAFQLVAIPQKQEMF